LRKSKFSLLSRYCLIGLLAFILIDAVYLISIWPDWDDYRQGQVQESSFIKQYQRQRRNSGWPTLKWTPVPFSRISENMTRALIVAEDANFYWHSGFDIDAFWSAMKHNFEIKRFAYGASTISQQTVKNLFFTPSRNPLRKWHELLLTMAMERQLPKRRILEIYLNIVEFGRGVYGVEAASRHYWGIPAAALSRNLAIQLAASLPAPVSHNPHSKTRFFERRVRKINRYF
jgi:monofunctional biosynthetic peptidoglycan transglycosylase